MAVERVYLIRHGETDWNTSGRWQGCLQVDLNVAGWAQAAKLAEALAGEGIEAIYTSDLSRAADTARVLGDRLGVTPRADPRLRELDIGCFQGMTVAEITARYPQEYADFMAAPLEYVLPGGESRQLLKRRAMAALGDYVAEAAAARIAVITHGGVVKALLAGLWPAEAARYHGMDIPNTSITTLERRGDAWARGRVADVAHLGGRDWSDEDAGVYF